MSDDVTNKLLEKIKKLRAKGADQAVGEDEAASFLDAAARLMADHGLSEKDVERAGIVSEFFEKKGVHWSTAKSHPAVFALASIGRLTGCAIGLRAAKQRRNGKTVTVCGLTIVGRKADCEVASYMFEQMRNLMDAAWAQERKRRRDKAVSVLGQLDGFHIGLLDTDVMQKALEGSGLATGTQQRRSFRIGMACRLAERIEAMATRNGDFETAKAAWLERNPDVKGPAKPGFKIDPNDFAHGARAGADASLGQGMAAATAAPLALPSR
jgi:Protein of unknown function (DUF2786)